MKTQQKNKQIWREVELGNLCKLITDGTHDKTPLVSKDNGFPLITSKDLTEDGISFENVLYITPEQHKQIIKRSNPEKGDILYSKIGTIGKPTIVNVDFEFSIKNVALFKLDKGLILPKYLIYYLRSPKIHKSLNEGAGGGNQKFIPLNKLKKMMIKLPFSNGKPDLETQKQIVVILEKAENLKQKQKKQLEFYDEYLKSVFYEMFLSHRDDPKGSKDKGKWEEIELGDKKLFDVQSGGTPKRDKKEYWDNGNIPWVGSTACKDLPINESEQFITEEGLKNSSAKLFPKETILVALVGATIGKTGILKFECCTNQNIAGIIIRDKNKIIPLYLFFSMKNLYNKFISLSSESFKMANLSFVRSLKIPLPPPELQQKFAAIVEKVENLKEKQKKGLEDSEELFNALMQRAFKGELS